MAEGHSLGGIIVGTSYNGIAAVNIGGDTLSGLLHVAFQKKGKPDDTAVLLQLNANKLEKFIADLSINDNKLLAIVVDEISTVSPTMLARAPKKIRPCLRRKDPSTTSFVLLIAL